MKVAQNTKKEVTKIYLIRHAPPVYYKDRENYFRDNTIPLSDMGIKHGKLVCRELMKKKIDKIFASNFIRSYQTAKFLAKKLGKNIDKEKALEEIDWKTWVKPKYFRISLEERRKQIPEYKKLLKELTHQQIKARRILGKIYRKYPNKKVAVFTHGNVIRTMITSVLGSHVIGFLSLNISMASISCIEVDSQGHVLIKYVNFTKHLDK